MKAKLLFPLLFAAVLLQLNSSASAAPIKTLIVDGQNNHDWAGSTPILKKYLEETGLFEVDVITSPPTKGDMNAFKPAFKKYKLVVSNYNGDPWSEETKQAFVDFVKNGGGFVSVHAADNSFPDWKEYNQMIGVGGWGGRNEKSGPLLRLRDGGFVPDAKPGPGGHHGAQHAFLMETRQPNHPIMRGLPTKWLHAKDELYDSLRGPGQNVIVLASAFSDPKTGGTGENEPLLLAISFGKGRVFHTALGHGMEAVKCAGFAATLQRGAEWAATGKVTQKVPVNFPAADKVSSNP